MGRASIAPTRELAEYCGIATLPAHPRKPRDKAKMEVAVQIVQRFVLPRLRNRRLFSLDELNAVIREVVDDLLRTLGASRDELFAEIDKRAFKAPPPEGETMLTHPTHDRLVALGLNDMAKTFDEQQRRPDIAALTFEEGLALLVDREATERENKRLVARLRASVKMPSSKILT